MTFQTFKQGVRGVKVPKEAVVVFYFLAEELKPQWAAAEKALRGRGFVTRHDADQIEARTPTAIPITAEDNAIALIRFESGAMGQFEVSWTFRGGMDLRDEVAGTRGTIWLNHFLRTGFEMFTAGAADGYIAEKLAAIKQLDVEELLEQVYRNSRALFFGAT